MALLETFRAAMAELKLKGKLIAADIIPAAAFHGADESVLVPHVDQAEYIRALLDIVERRKVSLVVPLTDLDLRVLARHRGRFAEIGCTVMIGSEEAISLCRDKARTNELLGECGLAPIRTCTVAQFNDGPFYPCFIKPIDGSAGIGTTIIRNEQELRAHIDRFGDAMLIQEYLPGREYTIDVYRTREGEVRCAVPRQRLVVRSGEVEKGITVRNDRLIEAATILANSLGDIWGVFCCQCRAAAGGAAPRFFEVNPRFGGGATLSIAAGANLPLYLLQDVLGRPITAELGRFTENLLMLRYDKAFFTTVDDPASLPGYNSPIFR